MIICSCWQILIKLSIFCYILSKFFSFFNFSDDIEDWRGLLPFFCIFAATILFSLKTSENTPVTSSVWLHFVLINKWSHRWSAWSSVDLSYSTQWLLLGIHSSEYFLILHIINSVWIKERRQRRTWIYLLGFTLTEQNFRCCADFTKRFSTWELRIIKHESSHEILNSTQGDVKLGWQNSNVSTHVKSFYKF